MPTDNPKDSKQTDFIPHGSEEHAALLGLRRATKEEMEKMVEDGFEALPYVLEDSTQFGVHATPLFLHTVTKQKISELTSPLPKIQSKDRRKPFFHEPIWLPKQNEQEEVGVQGIV